MQVYKVGIAEMAIDPLASKLKSALLLGKTLWLVPGGSNIKLATAVMARLDNESSRNLMIGLTDERYGPYNHSDSNWAQLIKAGFDPKQAQVIEVLTPDNLTLEKTATNYAQSLANALAEVKSSIGQFGMGSDGHIAGILPGSTAAQETDNLAVGYISNPFIRITISFSGIRRLHSAFLMAFGEEKKVQLDKLINTQLELSEQPAQILKQVAEALIYSDQIEGKMS